MTDTNKPTKPPLFVPAGKANLKPRREARADTEGVILEMADAIMDQYVAGDSLSKIAETLPIPYPAWKLRNLLAEHPQTAARYLTLPLERAHYLADEAVEVAHEARMIGDSAGKRVASDVYMKTAARLAPSVYGDKAQVELSGKDGGAIEMKADMTLTAAEAYERLIKGKQ